MKKNIILSTLVLFAMVLFTAQSCKHTTDVAPSQKSTDTTTNIDTSTTSNCDPDSVYFENTILPLITSSCAYAGCHDAITQEDGVILNSYTNIMQTGEISPGNPGASELYEVITETRADKVMPPPPASKLTPAQTELIQKWIQQGAKNNKCTDCDSTNVTYAKQVTTILNTNCITCHGANGSGGVSLNSYAAVKTQVDNGKLNGSINHSNGFKAMPPASKMNACNLEIIKKWIDNGAPNN